MARSKTEPYVAIKEDIIACRLKPGDIVNESKLAGAYGVSRTVVREALQALRRDGFVESIPRVGHVLCAVTVKDVIDLFGVRAIVEPAATALAAKKAHAEEIDRILAMAEEGATSEVHHGALTRINSEFHLAIAEASHNSILASIEFSLMERLERLSNLHLLGDISNRRAITLEQHGVLADAIGSRDAQEAREIALAQIQGSKERLLRDLLTEESVPGVSISG